MLDQTELRAPSQKIQGTRIYYKAFLPAERERSINDSHFFEATFLGPIVLIDHTKLDAAVPPRIRAAVYAGCLP